jgi:hypothetical protein
MSYFLSGIGFVLIWLAFAFFQLVPWVMPPVNVMAAGLFAGIAVASIPIWKRRRSSRDLMAAIVLYAVFAGGLVAIQNYNDGTPVNRFTKLYWKIHTGMTKNEVEEVIREIFPAVQPSIQWDEDVGFINLGPVDPDYDAEVIQVDLVDGRVAGTSYSPD